MTELQKRVNSDLSEIKMFSLYKNSSGFAQGVSELFSVLEIIEQEPDPSRVFQSFGNKIDFYQVKTTVLKEGDQNATMI